MSHGHCGIVKPGTSPQSLGAAARDVLHARHGEAAVRSHKDKKDNEEVIEELASLVAKAVANF